MGILKTYVGCEALSISKVTLAKHKIRYLSDIQCLQCVLCSKVLQKSGIHFTNLDCPHKGSEDTADNTMDTAIDTDEELIKPYRGITRTSTCTSDEKSDSERTASVTNTPGTSGLSSIRTPRLPQSELPRPPETNQQLNIPVNSVALRQNLSFSEVQMEYRENREATFRDIPWPYPVKGDELARAGFYAVGPRDRVRCFSCKKRIKNWRIGDNAMSEHRRLSPFCAFAYSADESTNGS